MTTTASPDDLAVLETVFERLYSRGADGSVSGTTIGDRLVAVELDGANEGRMGVAHRPPGATATPVPDDALELARWSFRPPTPGNALEVALGVATLNALSAPMVSWTRGDPMSALSGDVDRIATVGLFRPAFRKLDAIEVRVIEREPVDDVAAPDGVDVTVFPPADREAAIDGVDVLFVTGSSLLYGGTTAYLRAAVDVPSVVLIGATASFLPEPAFDAGATVVAGARVTAPERVRRGIEAGYCGTDLHDGGLEKGYVAAEPYPDGLDLTGESVDPATDRY